VALTDIQSPPLVDIITHINSYSSNLGAELLLKRIGWEMIGVGSTAAGTDAVRSILAENGIPVEQLVIDDGSGLAETDRVTCQVLAGILADAGADSAFAESLSIGGERGSLGTRFEGAPADGLVPAKTGTLNTVSARSGYVQSATDGAVALIFAYVANEEPTLSNDAAKSIQDEIVNSLTSYPGPPTIEVLLPLDPVPA
jgi:D-alanyl-D-alanine carboxypeptidase/D-alanyl-D-alanine-endopeptidase (penicillin-binding protein 4)